MQLKCKAAVWDKVISKFDLFAAGKITAEQKTANMDLWARCFTGPIWNQPEMPRLLKILQQVNVHHS